MLLSQPDSGEQALEIADALIDSGSIDIIIIDSVAALTPKVEIEGEIGDHTIGAQARLMSKALRKLSGSIRKSNCIVIFINQIREKVGIIFGNPETTPGGRALKFYASLRMEIRAGEKLKDGTEFIGQVVRVKIVKNKVAPPYKNTQIEILFNKGINRDNEIITLASDYDIIEKSGS
jgi:recombination protein RecA